MKKLIALILTLASIACIFCGCNNTSIEDDSSPKNNISSEESEQVQTVSFPTLPESLEFAQKEFPEYKDSILYLNNQVNLSKNGISFVVFYENNKFQKIWCKNSDFSSAFKVLSNYFLTFADIGITEEELENNMKVSTEMPNWTSYTYEDNNFEYGITVGLDYVQISMTSKTGSLKISIEQKNSSGSTLTSESQDSSAQVEETTVDSELIGNWNYNYAYDLNTASPTTPTKPYVSFYKFNSNGTGSLTVMYEGYFDVIDTTWEFDYEEDDIYYYAVYLRGDKSEKIDVAYVDGVIAMQKGSALMYFKKQ
ncbi:MAG: hypothetical protein E7548_06915 [Ruminococcaceae bacterium]|nr:hypothetical protein [Oscillospiraceae bacterium]